MMDYYYLEASKKALEFSPIFVILTSIKIFFNFLHLNFFFGNLKNILIIVEPEKVLQFSY
jgi:hypothetical protein